jgi:hypothetical protein
MKIKQPIKLYSDNFLEMLNLWSEVNHKDLVCPYKRFILKKLNKISCFKISNCNECEKIFKYKKTNLQSNQQIVIGLCPCQEFGINYVEKRLIELGYKIENNKWTFKKHKQKGD